jgi:hypothetical protein
VTADPTSEEQNLADDWRVVFAWHDAGFTVQDFLDARDAQRDEEQPAMRQEPFGVTDQLRADNEKLKAKNKLLEPTLF